MIQRCILLADNDTDFLNARVELLEQHGYRVVAAVTPEAARKVLEEEQVDLAILDVRMRDDDDEKDISGLMAATEVNSHVPRIILTNYPGVDLVQRALSRERGSSVAEGFLWKAEGPEELFAEMDKVLGRKPSILQVTQPRSCTLRLGLNPGDKISIEARGVFVHDAMTTARLRRDSVFDVGLLGQSPPVDWRSRAKQTGIHLHRRIFTEHPQILSAYSQALGILGRDHALLHVRVAAAREFLRVPIETCFEPNEGYYFVQRHPVARIVSDAPTTKQMPSPEFFERIRNGHQKLSILLIGSNTLPDIPGVDAEIQELDRSLKGIFEAQGIPTLVEAIHTDSATLDRVQSALRHCKFHIVHYAGHGTYVPYSPEKTYLSFWEKSNRQGKLLQLSSNKLEAWLREQTQTSFVYLSCCLGATTGTQDDLGEDDFLGLADAIVHSGVPSVLGFRWRLSDTSAQRMAIAFYSGLAEYKELDTALLRARTEVAIDDPDDRTWLSPILVMQG